MSDNLEKDNNIQQKTDIKYMKQALKLAYKARDIMEVPIGCVIVHDGKVIAKGYNKRNRDGMVLAHAEIEAIRKACKKLHDWRLEDCTMYVTLEPCPMCAGAIVQSRMKRVVIASMNPKAGCAGSLVNILQLPGLNHRVELETGVMDEECSAMLSDFFSNLRAIKKAQNIDKTAENKIK